jgi:hypothetical protein
MLRAFLSACRRFHRDEGGQAIFLGVFYFALLAGLTFLVVNSGHKANNKIQLQNTADAVVGSGASWCARTLNTVSMCNVTQTQLFSTIVLLDTMEEVGPPAQRIIDDLISNIGSSAHGSDVPLEPSLKDWLIVNNAAEEQSMVRRLNQLIADIPVSQYCKYDSGTLWQCAYVLNELKTQMVDVAPTMIQNQAMAVGDLNNAESAFVLPFYPELPIREIDNSGASFRLFRVPMEFGRRVYTTGGGNPSYPPTTRSVRRHRPIAGYYYLMGYAWHGWYGRSGSRSPLDFMRDPITTPSPMGLLELSRYSVLFRVVSDKKVNMLFGGPNEKACLEPTNRIETYDELVDYVSKNGREAVIRTYWTHLSFASLYEYDTPQFRNQSNRRYPAYPQERLSIYDGYRPAPNGYTRATTQTQGADPRHDLWFRSQLSRTPYFPQLGILPDHGPPWDESDMQDYYRNSLWRFDGADVGEERDLKRDYLPPVGSPPRMAPIELRHDTGRKTRDNVFQHFTLVGFAADPGVSMAWPSVFVNPVPTNDKLICYAQAEVYNETGNAARFANDSGWDLFTQNWRYRLIRCDHWQWARDQMNAGVPSGARGDALSLTEDQLGPVRTMLEMYDPEFAKWVTH